MIKKILFVLSVFSIFSCTTIKKQQTGVKKKKFFISEKHYIKKYTRNFVNSIPQSDLEFILGNK